METATVVKENKLLRFEYFSSSYSDEKIEMVHFFVWGETRERIRNGIIYLHFLACLFSFSFLYIKKKISSPTDFSASGFSLYDGRWVLVRSGLIPISWDLALLYCNNRYANMFIPRSSSDWSWMMSKMGILDFGCFVPINDKAVEGQLVWNDGTCWYPCHYVF